MKHSIGLIFLALLSICGMGQEQNVVYDENAEARTVEAFNSIEVSGTVSLYISQGATQGVAVSAGDGKYNSKIKTEVKNGTLHISVDGGVWNNFNWSNKKLKAYVTVTTLNRLESSGATYVSMAGTIKGDKLKIETSGASEIKGNIDFKKLDIDISGASVAKLSGLARNANLEASGACEINSYHLYIDTCSVSSSGASGVRVFVKDQLSAEASGGSSVYYKGKPSSTNFNSSGGSTIKFRGEED